MKTIRLGNDIVMTWTVSDMPSDAGTLEVKLIDPDREEATITTSSTVSDGTAVFSITFYGKDQEVPGVYRLLLLRNEGEEDMNTLDQLRCFELVSLSAFGISDGEDDAELGVTTVDLTSIFNTGGGTTSLEYYSEDTTAVTATIDTGEASVSVTNEGIAVTTDDGTFTYNGNNVTTAADFKTINNTSIVGTGNIEVAADLTYYTEDATNVSAEIDTGSASIVVENTDAGTITEAATNIALTGTNVSMTDNTSSVVVSSSGVSITDSASTIAVGDGISVSVGEGTTFTYKGSEVAVADDFDDYYTSDEVNQMVGAKANKMTIVSVAEGTTTLTAEENKYYKFAGSVSTLAITLPQPSAQYTQSIVFHLTTGASPSVTFSPSGLIEVFDGFAISTSKTYEVNALWNGSTWTLAQAIIS